MIKQQVAIVTGGGRRLGRFISVALSNNGFTVIVNYNHSKTDAIETVNLIENNGGSAISIKADVSKSKDVHKLVKFVIARYGKIDLLVNNAAIFLHSPLLRTSERNWDYTIDINLKGTFLCSQEVASYMLKEKSGRIINIASLGGVQPWKKYLPYSVSKAGVIMLTKLLAKSLAPNIQVNAIAPGLMMLDRSDKNFLKKVQIGKIPLRKYGDSSDITDMIIYLATASKYITGQTFLIDGGKSL